MEREKVDWMAHGCQASIGGHYFSWSGETADVDITRVPPGE